MALPLTVLRPSPAVLPLHRSDVMRYLGYRPGQTLLKPEHEELVDRGIALTLEAAAPAAAISYCGVAVAGEAEVRTRLPGLTWHSRSLAGLLREAGGVTLVTATLGPGVDELIQRLFSDDEYALAVIVDTVGSALIHGFGEWIRGGLDAGEHVLTSIYGPGYGDWPITDMIGLVAAAGGPHIGLACTETCYLQPQKSLAGLIGWRAPGRPVRSGCALCTLPDCAYRLRG